MNNEGALGIILIALLLGGIVLLRRRPAVDSNYVSAPDQYQSNSIRLLPVQEEPRRYQNKEIRNIEYNDDGLPTKIEIIRDYAIR